MSVGQIVVLYTHLCQTSKAFVLGWDFWVGFDCLKVGLDLRPTKPPKVYLIAKPTFKQTALNTQALPYRVLSQSLFGVIGIDLKMPVNTGILLSTLYVSSQVFCNECLSSFRLCESPACCSPSHCHTTHTRSHDDHQQSSLWHQKSPPAHSL